MANQTPALQVPGTGRRLAWGIKVGFVSGGTAGFVAILALTAVFAVFGVVTRSPELGAGLFVFMVFGLPIAMIAGALSGTLAGAILGATGTHRLAPWLFAIVAAAFPAAVIAVRRTNGWKEHVSYAIAAVGFAAIGHMAGSSYDVSMNRRIGRYVRS